MKGNPKMSYTAKAGYLFVKSGIILLVVALGGALLDFTDPGILLIVGLPLLVVGVALLASDPYAKTMWRRLLWKRPDSSGRGHLGSYLVSVAVISWIFVVAEIRNGTMQDSWFLPSIICAVLFLVGAVLFTTDSNNPARNK